MYERTLQKLNQQLQASLASMAGEKNALLLSLTALQDQFEAMANAVYTAEETVVGMWSTNAIRFMHASLFILLSESHMDAGCSKCCAFIVNPWYQSNYSCAV